MIVVDFGGNVSKQSKPTLFNVSLTKFDFEIFTDSKKLSFNTQITI